MNNVKDFGAVGDGVIKDTAAVQRAIDAGGTVYFPKGTYLCGTLYLKDNTGLHLEDGALLLASPDQEDYNPDYFCTQNAPFTPECVSGAHFIVAVEKHNVSITGQGRIDGNRKAFYPDYPTRSEMYTTPIKWRPGQMLFFCECKNVTIAGVQLWNAPYWTCFLHGCENVTVTGLKIYNFKHTRNGDGIDIDCCRFVTVSDCIIDSGDDSITLRANNTRLKTKRACEYITITNCILKTICNAFRIGVGNGTIRMATISNVIIQNSRTAITIGSKYSSDRGVRIEELLFNNIFVESEIPVLVLINSGAAKGPAIQPVSHITFSHLRINSQYGMLIRAENLGEMTDIRMNDVEITCSDPLTADTVAANEVSRVTAALRCDNISGLQLNNVRLRDPSPERNGLILNNCENVNTNDCNL